MAAGARKYNPAFLSNDELIAAFCVRTAEYESLIEALRECSGSANTHQIVIGPRGSGKTSLLLRVAAEMLRDADLSARFFPIVFAEESYEVSTAGEFWLECLSRLADQAPRRDGDVNLHRTFEEMRAIHDDRALEDRCLGVLQDFADLENKRLVLIVENLNMMFRDMGDDDAGWRLRKMLQTEPRIVLLASATSRFDQMDDPKEALYELFRVIRLHPLDTEGCATLWQTVSGQARAPQTIRALQILTGGNPRLLTIVARFGANLSFRELMADLLDLVDDHTEYFKSHLDALPAQERKVFLALADLWKPANAREISERARLGTSKCSAQLARLIDRGAVEVSGGTPRRKLYYLTERLYNIYYLMRRARRPTSLIDALIRFMEAYYSTDQLREFGTRMAREALSLDEDALINWIAFECLVELPSLEAHREELLSLAPPALVSPAPSAAEELFGKALALAKNGRLQDAVAAWDEVVQRFGESDAPMNLEQVSMALVNKGKALLRLGRLEEALAAWNEITQRFGKSRMPALEVPVVNALLGTAFALNKLNRHGEALEACDKVLERVGKSVSPALQCELAAVMVERGRALIALNRVDEAMNAWGAVAERFEDNNHPSILAMVAYAEARRVNLLEQLGRYEEALAVWDEIERRFRNSDVPRLVTLAAISFLGKSTDLFELNRTEEALATCDQAVGRFGDSVVPGVVDTVAGVLLSKGIMLAAAHRNEEALAVWNEIERRFGNGDEPRISNKVASALVNKGLTLALMNRKEDAIEVWSDVVRRFGAGDASPYREQITTAAVSKVLALELLGRPREALETCDEVIRRFEASDVPALLCRRSLIRARGHLAEGDGEAGARDIETALSVLPELKALPRDVVVALVDLSKGVGPERMCDLIKSSPADDLLLPLRTALERELGLKPRVAREVEEIADDIRRGLLARPNVLSWKQ